MSGPFELLGDPGAEACEGDVCAVPAAREQAPDDERDVVPDRTPQAPVPRTATSPDGGSARTVTLRHEN